MVRQFRMIEIRLGLAREARSNYALRERLLATLPSLVSELREVRSAADAAMARFRSADDR